MRFAFDSKAHAPRGQAVRAMGVLGLAGGVLSVVSATTPPTAEGSEAMVLVIGALSVLWGVYLLAMRPVLGERGLAVLSVLGTTLITIATKEGGLTGGAADNEILYLWVIFYVFYFLTLPNALLQTVLVGAGYAWVLSTQDVGLPGVTQWLVTMSSLFVAGLIIARLRGDLYRHVGDLSERASRDELTGLLNRGSLEERFDVERARAAREGGTVSVLAVDVDEFKALNDTLGHPTGDKALRQVAAALQHWTREVDASARVGGDEFAVVLAGAGAGDAMAVAEDLRSAVARSPLQENIRVTVSIGATTSLGPVSTFGELWQAADAAMYEAKRGGGDRVRFRGADEKAGEPEAAAAAESGAESSLA